MRIIMLLTKQDVAIKRNGLNEPSTIVVTMEGELIDKDCHEIHDGQFVIMSVESAPAFANRRLREAKQKEELNVHHERKGR